MRRARLEVGWWPRVVVSSLRGIVAVPKLFNSERMQSRIPGLEPWALNYPLNFDPDQKAPVSPFKSPQT